MYSDPLAPAAPAPSFQATRQPRVAIIGSGIAGLAAAHTLQGLAHITLFEAGDYFGGHTHTVDMTLPNAQGMPTTFGVDTGFLVLNERTYPNLLALLAALDVPIAKSDMSFSVQAPGAAPDGGTLEWSGSSLSTVFAQRGNLTNPRFWRMLADIVRFNRITTKLAERGEDLRPNSPLLQPLGEFLREQRFSDEFRDWYFLPMMGCIWSCPTDQMLAFPVATMVRFCHNHGLIQITNRPQWYTVAGGARQYVDKITARIPDRRLLTPVLQVLRPISPIAWIPLAILWFGIGSKPTIFIIFLAAFFPVTLSSIAAVKSVDPLLLRVARNFGATPGQMLVKVVLPAAFPYIAAGLHMAMGAAWIFLVAGEMVGLRSGLGYLIIDGRNQVRYDLVMASMVIIGALGLVIDRLMRAVESRLMGRWGIRRV